MPLGLSALLAVGIHGAADAVDDRLLWAVDQLDALADGLFARWELTAPLVRWVDLEDATWLARALTLCWELAVDAAVALPALGYRESDAPLPSRRPWRTPPRRVDLRPLVRRLFERPAPMRLLRPAAAGAFALAGACAVARLVQAESYFWLRAAGHAAANGGARLCALAALGWVLAALGGRAVLRSAQHAERAGAAVASRAGALRLGFWGNVLSAPLALAAVLWAAPWASFFR